MYKRNTQTKVESLICYFQLTIYNTHFIGLSKLFLGSNKFCSMQVHTFHMYVLRAILPAAPNLSAL